MKCYGIFYLFCVFGLNGGTAEQEFSFNTSNFNEIVTTPMFVDKSMMIKTFFQESEQAMVIAPQHFGKSTNMDMLKNFLEVSVDRNGLPVHGEDNLTENCLIFKRHNLKIYQDNEFFQQHCGQHPVIFIDFQSVVGNTLSEILGKFKTVLHRTFQTYGYLLNNAMLSETFSTQFNLYHEQSYATLTETDILWGFRVLSELLHKYFQKEVFILIDNFDHPCSHENIYSDVQKRKIVDFVRDLTSYLLKCNPHVNRALLNACSPPSQSLFLGMTGVEQYAFADDHNYAEYYGFTEGEVYDLVGRFKIFDEYIKMKRCCDEYRVKGRKLKIYNPWSVVCYLQYSC